MLVADDACAKRKPKVDIIAQIPHSSSAYPVAFSPDGGRVLRAALTTPPRWWDPATAAPIRTFKGHANGVRSVAYLRRSRDVPFIVKTDLVVDGETMPLAGE